MVNYLMTITEEQCIVYLGLVCLEGVCVYIYLCVCVCV